MPQRMPFVSNGGQDHCLLLLIKLDCHVMGVLHSDEQDVHGDKTDTRACVYVPSTATGLPCEWCSQSVSMVTCLCVQCPHRETGPATEYQIEAELSIPPQPKPNRPIIARVAGDVFSQGLTRSSRQKCLQTSQSRQQGAVRISHQGSSNQAQSLDLDRRKQAYRQGRGLYPQSSGGSRDADPLPCCPERTEPSLKGRGPWALPTRAACYIGELIDSVGSQARDNTDAAHGCPALPGCRSTHTWLWTGPAQACVLRKSHGLPNNWKVETSLATHPWFYLGQ